MLLKNGHNRADIDRFFTIAANGFYDTPYESSAVAFRNYVLTAPVSETGSRHKQRMMEFVVCLRSFADFEARKPRKLPYRTKDLEKYDAFAGSPAEAILMQYANEKVKEPQDEGKPDEDERIKPEDRRAGSILRKARLDKGWSVPELAKYTGFDVATILNFETGAYHISENANNSFKYALGCDIKREVAAS